MNSVSPKRAITREPGNKFTRCVSCHPNRDSVNLDKAREQHRAYCRTLADLGLEIIKLPIDNEHPDSCFVEDCAVVQGERALITRMAVDARRGEDMAVEQLLKQYLKIKRAMNPATIEGGDVVHLPDRLLSGLTQRTNLEGVKQMGDWLQVCVDTIEDPKVMHLKSHVTYLGRGVIVATRAYANHPALHGCKVLEIPEGEEYATNTLAIGDTVLMAAGRDRAAQVVRGAGFEVIPMRNSEFEKCDGALTCLSIVF